MKKREIVLVRTFKTTSISIYNWVIWLGEPKLEKYDVLTHEINEIITTKWGPIVFNQN